MYGHFKFVGFMWVRRGTKLLALILGFGGTVICLMATVGSVVENGFARFALALLRAQNLNLAVPVNVLKREFSSNYPARRKVGQAKRGFPMV